jgi:8-oxo-dGTP pyrophosphatase MutT (NUDIX family)
MAAEGWDDIALKLGAALTEPLPGRPYQEAMMPASRRGEAAPRDPIPSAVLLAVVIRGPDPALLFIKRAAGGPHGGQIAFPGGKREQADAFPIGTALREAREEIGLEPSSVQVLGLLSPLTISLSGFLVQPVAGLVARPPEWKPNPGEIDGVFEIPLSELLRTEKASEREILVRGQSILVPCYVFGELLVWGATAMMLAEFAEALARAKMNPK